MYLLTLREGIVPGEKPVSIEVAVVRDYILFDKPLGEKCDSGSLVFTDPSKRPHGVAMVVAADFKLMLTLVTPLWAVLDDAEEQLNLPDRPLHRTRTTIRSRWLRADSPGDDDREPWQ